MKTFIKSHFKAFLLAIIFIVPFTSSATHTGALELSYRHISGNTYEFTLLFYRNCLGSTAGAPSSFNIAAQSNSLGVNNFNAVQLNQLPTFGPLAPPLQPANLYNCLSAPLCHEEYVYRGTLNLNTLSASPNARDWVFSTQLCCYPSAIDNISAGTIRTEAGLNNFDFSTGNDSPFWHTRRPNHPSFPGDTVISYPLASICATRSIVLEQDVREYDGDVVKYSFHIPQNAGGVPSTYVGPYSLTTPLPFRTPLGFEIDSVTGEIPFIAENSVDDQFVIGITAEEYRTRTIIVGGVTTTISTRIGYVRRNLTIILEDSTNCPDNGFNVKTKSMNVLCNSTTLTIDMKDNYVCSSADIDGSFISLVNKGTSASIPISGVSPLNCFYGISSKRFAIDLINPLGPGKYYLMFQNGTDGNTIISECGIELTPLADTILITVDSATVPEVTGGLDMNGNIIPFLSAECGEKQLILDLTSKVYCDSIEPLGSDFILMDSIGSTPMVVPIASATPYQCSKDFTDKVILTLQNGLQPGNYGLFTTVGNDGNSLVNACGDQAVVKGIPLTVSSFDVDLGPDLQYCKDSIFMALLDAGEAASYSWNTGENVQQIIVITQGVYTVEIENDFGCKALDSVIVTEIDCATGLATNEIEDFKVFPSPADQTINVVFSALNDDAEIQLLDLKGKVIRSQRVSASNDRYQFDVSNVPTGVYFLNMTDAKGNLSSRKVIINH